MGSTGSRTRWLLSCVARRATAIVLWVSGSARAPVAPALRRHCTYFVIFTTSPQGWPWPLCVWMRTQTWIWRPGLTSHGLDSSPRWPRWPLLPPAFGTHRAPIGTCWVFRRRQDTPHQGNWGVPHRCQQGVTPGDRHAAQVRAFASSPSSGGPSPRHLKVTSTAESTVPTGSRAHSTPTARASLQGG